MLKVTDLSITRLDDGELSALAERFTELRQRFLALSAGEYNDASFAEAAAIGRFQRRIAMAMSDIVATSEAGHRAKGAVLLAAAHRNPAGGLAWSSLCEKLGQSLALDLTGGEGLS